MALVIGRGAQQRARESEIRPFFAIVIGKCSTESEGETERGRAFFALVIGGYSIESERERDRAFFCPSCRRMSTESERERGRERDQALFSLRDREGRSTESERAREIRPFDSVIGGGSARSERETPGCVAIVIRGCSTHTQRRERDHGGQNGLMERETDLAYVPS